MTSPSKKPTGGPAFPRAGNEWSDMEWVPAPDQAGMTLRDYFAAKAMQGLIAYHGDKMHIVDSDGRTSLHFAAYDHADAMLKARDGKADQPEDPCPGCRPGVVCRTPSCGRLKARDGSR